jgi:hypothetical protein
MVVKVFVQYQMASVQYCSLRPSGIRQVVETRLSAIGVVVMADRHRRAVRATQNLYTSVKLFCEGLDDIRPQARTCAAVFPQTNAVVGHRQAPVGSIDIVPDQYFAPTTWECVLQCIDHRLRNNQPTAPSRAEVRLRYRI